MPEVISLTSILSPRKAVRNKEKIHMKLSRFITYQSRFAAFWKTYKKLLFLAMMLKMYKLKFVLAVTYVKLGVR